MTNYQLILNCGQTKLDMIICNISAKQAFVLTFLQYKLFEKVVGKGEIAYNKQFLLFPMCFLPFWRPFFVCQLYLSLEESKICHLGKV